MWLHQITDNMKENYVDYDILKLCPNNNTNLHNVVGYTISCVFFGQRLGQINLKSLLIIFNFLNAVFLKTFQKILCCDRLYHLAFV